MGHHCMDDCSMSKYGPSCAHKCGCNSTDLCHNLDGSCYPKDDYVFNLNLLFNCYALQSQRFVALKEKLKENTALLVWNCLKGGGSVVGEHCLDRNHTRYVVLPQPSKQVHDNNNKEELLREIRLINTFFVRIVDMVPKYSSTNQPVCVVSMSLLNNTVPLNGSIVERMLEVLPTGVLTKALTYMQQPPVYVYYKGDIYDEKRSIDEIMTKMQWIVIGLSSKELLCTWKAVYLFF